MRDAAEIFIRRSDNPILTTEDWPYPVNAVFNAGATVQNGETLLLVRVEDRTGVSHLTAARSPDGFKEWRVDPAPSMKPHPHHPEERWGLEDPRVVWLDALNCWAVTYTAYSSDGPLVALATTVDFRTFERLGRMTTPENKDAALFAKQIHDRWLMIHRPVCGMSTNADIWISESPDLVHWGRHQPLLRGRGGPYWDAGRIGLSAPPLLTGAGWLILYHGVKKTCSGPIYRQGLALLDREEPTHVLGRSGQWVFSPTAPYERTGDVGNVVFCCGWVLVGDEVRIYYGGADSCMAVATASLEELMTCLEPVR